MKVIRKTAVIVLLAIAGLMVAEARAQEPSLDDLAKQFQNPGPQWRAKPVWTWSGGAKKEDLVREVGAFKERGAGGFIMRPRAGQQDAVNACADEAKRLGLEAWLDLADFPTSGAATLEPKYRAQYLTMWTIPAAYAESAALAPDAVATYAVRLGGADRLDFTDSQRLSPLARPEAWKGKDLLIFRVETATTAALNRLSREATDVFIGRALEPWRVSCGARLGDSVKGIFSDGDLGGVLDGPTPTTGALPGVPWTEKMAERFRTKYQDDLLDHLPELFLRPQGQKMVKVKWQYMDILNETFLENHARPIQEWCRRNRVAAAGWTDGSITRCEYLDAAGATSTDAVTLKRLGSAAHQLGCKGIAARNNATAPAGKAREAEDEAARAALLLAQGKPGSDVLVIDSRESAWAQIHVGWAQGGAVIDPDIQQLQERQATLVKWLTGAQIDFDFADEALLARWGRVELGPDGKSILHIGQAPYRVAALGGLATLRETTLNLLGELVSGGGYMVCAGDLPPCVDAEPNQSNESLASHGMIVDWNGQALTEALAAGLRGPAQALGEGDKPVEDLCCQVRVDGERRWLVARNIGATARPGVRMRIGGPGTVTEWVCKDGTRRAAAAQEKEGLLEWTADFAPGAAKAWLIAAP